jgi:hypothetical protein
MTTFENSCIRYPNAYYVQFRMKLECPSVNSEIDSRPGGNPIDVPARQAGGIDSLELILVSLDFTNSDSGVEITMNSRPGFLSCPVYFASPCCGAICRLSRLIKKGGKDKIIFHPESQHCSWISNPCTC